MTTCAWLWVYAGLLLMLAELMVPGFIMVFFGLAAASVGVLRFCFADAFDLTWQLAAFSVFSVLYIFLLRRWLKNVFTGSKVEGATDFNNEYVGRLGKVIEEINPPVPGRVIIGETGWKALSDRPIAAGADIKVVSQNNLTMKVEECK